MNDYWSASNGAPWAAVTDLERVLAAQPGDHETRLQLAHALYAALAASISVTRDQTLEITSARQTELAEQVAQRILDLNVADEDLRRHAQALLHKATEGRLWTWESAGGALAATVLAVVAGIAAAVLGGLNGNLVVVLAGAVVSSALVAVIVLRFRRQNWKIRAEQVAPLIWRPGV